MTTVAEALAEARARGLERLDAQLLLAHHLGQSRSWLLAHGDDRLEDALADQFGVDCERRAAGAPLAYVIGRWPFRGLSLAVSPAVLIPRPETEVLVDWALELLAGPLAGLPAPRVLDLGTGSGAIGLSIARECPRARVTATDLDAEALKLARRNGEAFGLDIEWLAGDWWQALGRRRFDLVLANPPYVADDDVHLEALTHEPRRALAAGPDGLDALKTVIAGAAPHLAPDGWLLLEHGHAQAEALCLQLLASAYADIQTRCDLARLPRCTGGRLA